MALSIVIDSIPECRYGRALKGAYQGEDEYLKTQNAHERMDA